MKGHDMSEPNEIRFTYGRASAKLNSDKNKLEYDGEDKNKLRAGLQNIFNAIKKLDNPDNKKIDSTRETELLNKLSSIFQAGGSTNIDDDEMAWAKGFQAGGDVVEFINTKYNEVVGRQQDGQVNNDGVVEEEQQQQQQQPTVVRNVTIGGEIQLKETIAPWQYVNIHTKTTAYHMNL